MRTGREGRRFSWPEPDRENYEWATLTDQNELVLESAIFRDDGDVEFQRVRVVDVAHDGRGRVYNMAAGEAIEEPVLLANGVWFTSYSREGGPVELVRLRFDR